MTSMPVAGSDRRLIYTGRTTCWPMVVATCVGMVLLLLMSGGSDGSEESASSLSLVVGLIAVGLIAEVLTASSVRATAGPNGFTVRWGVVGWPRATYGLDQIERAEVIDLPWWRVSWSFWWTHKRTSCTLRSGPTVQLTLRTGRIVTITVPEPAAAVAAIHDAAPRTAG